MKVLSSIKAAAAVALMISAAGVNAHPINLSISGGQRIWTDFQGGTRLDPGAYYQVWWSSDAQYGQISDGLVSETTAGLGTGQQDLSTGDYVLLSGATPALGGWSGLNPIGQFTDAQVGGNTISSGYVYIYVYDDFTVSPDAGDSYVRSPIYGNAWGDPTAPQPPPADTINMAPNAGDAVLGSHFVVPEPGTMALFGIGMLTIIARRRRS